MNRSRLQTTVKCVTVLLITAVAMLSVACQPSATSGGKGARTLSIEAPALSEARLTEVAAQAEFVFVGTIMRMGKASFRGVPTSARTAVVRVDEVLDKPAGLPVSNGDRITVELKDESSFRKGVQATFYANSWVFGEGLAVREVAHESAQKWVRTVDRSTSAAQLARARRQVSDAKLRKHIMAADAVVVGRVVSVGPSTLTALGAPQGPVTEHDPQWQEAVIEVQSSIKGAEPNQRMVVRFATSRDVAWYRAPKLNVGQEGTFLLKKDQVSATPQAMLEGQQVDAYTVLAPSDVLRKQDAQRVRALHTP